MASARHGWIGAAVPALLALAMLSPAPALATAGSAGTKRPRSKDARRLARRARALLDSRELWATIDVCSPADQPNMVGIRGSMPGDGQAHDSMYMSFRLQYLGPGGQWVDLLSGATPAYTAVGAAGSVRQGGVSFQLAPKAGRAVTMRGVVDFQWRRGRTILYTAARTTAAGHASRVGADPAGYSTASCVIG